MKKIILVTAFICSTFANAQTQIFPANKTYANGLMATNKNSQDVTDAYNTWKTNFAESCSNGRYRVKFDDPSKTVSEGIGYGMLLSVYMGDKTLFDGFWQFYKDNRNSNGVMNWKINGCSGIDGQNGATDAELDVAFALIVADYQWGSTGTINYAADGKSLINTIKNHEVEASTFVLKPGDVFGGSNITNPSYFAPGYYRAFGVFTNDISFWNSVASKSYSIINANLTKNNAAGGLVSDWCNADGNYSSDAGYYANQGKEYTYDAARTPWRIAIDYLWNGTTEAKNYSKKSSDFVRVNLGGSSNIKDGYNQNGTASGQWHNATFVGAFACAAMGGENQSHLDASYTDLKNLNEPNSYFNHTLKTLYLLALTGNFYLPPTATLGTSDFSSTTDGVAIYPNPSQGVFTISTPEKSEIIVISPQGNMISKQKTTAEKTEINLAGKAAGIYLVKVINSQKSITKKVILE